MSVCEHSPWVIAVPRDYEGGFDYRVFCQKCKERISFEDVDSAYEGNFDEYMRLVSQHLDRRIKPRMMYWPEGPARDLHPTVVVSEAEAERLFEEGPA